jgi:nucleotide-binding universal stress UspA family protein
MACKTILVHCNDKQRVARIAGSAAGLGERLGSHLIGLSVAPPFQVVPTGMPAAPDALVIDDRAQAYRRDNPMLKAAFEAAVRDRSVTSEWREEDAGSATVADIVIRHASGADLVVVAQRDPHWPESPWLEVAERLAVDGGRPVLIVPNAGAYSEIGTTALVAWNGRREATRAAFDAVPLLQQARSVKVLSVDAQTTGASTGTSAGDFAAMHLCAGLARHGVTCEAVEGASDGSIGHALLDRAAEHGADLLVMGCYGHSRLAELVFGGATRHVLTHMTIPVLMSH